MTSLDEVDRKLSQVLKEIQTIQVDLKLNKILELLVQSERG